MVSILLSITTDLVPPGRPHERRSSSHRAIHPSQHFGRLPIFSSKFKCDIAIIAASVAGAAAGISVCVAHRMNSEVISKQGAPNEPRFSVNQDQDVQRQGKVTKVVEQLAGPVQTNVFHEKMSAIQIIQKDEEHGAGKKTEKAHNQFLQCDSLRCESPRYSTPKV
jgi:hypothetical protein